MSRILVIDDEELVRSLMVEILEAAEHEVAEAGDFRRALELIEREEFDLVVSDVVMPGCSGLDLLEAVHTRRASLPVVLVTGAGTYETLNQALARGAAGLVTKPFSHAQLQETVAEAVARAERSERELRARLLTPTLASALANAIEARDPHLSGHCERLATIAVGFAVRLGLPASQVEAVRLGAILHDVGKIGIPDRILLKPGAFEGDEREQMQRHPVIGDELLAPLDLLASSRPVIRHHHERWDGAGYPDGLAGEAIPAGARIVAVADAIEVMSTRTTYGDPLDRDGVLAELHAGRATQWDPRVVDLALELVASGELRVGSGCAELVAVDAPERRATAASVLVVDQNGADVELLRAAVEEAVAGVHVAVAADLATAVDLCRTSAWSLVLVGDPLPGADGLDVLDAIRAEEPALPVVVLAADPSEGLALEAFRRGASDYVVKRNGFVEELTRRVRSLAVAS
jgi:putative two-component system response regulator